MEKGARTGGSGTGAEQGSRRGGSGTGAEKGGITGGFGTGAEKNARTLGSGTGAKRGPRLGGSGTGSRKRARTGAGSGAVAEISNSIASKRQPRSQAFNKKHQNQKRGKGQKWVKICKWILKKHTKTIPPHL